MIPSLFLFSILSCAFISSSVGISNLLQCGSKTTQFKLHTLQTPTHDITTILTTLRLSGGQRSEVEEEYDEDFIPPNEDETAENTANIQFMITNRMRYILENDLGYSPEEVDDMEPQIAAVVISRSLARPAKGMPDGWRRPETALTRSSNPVAAFLAALNKVASVFQSAIMASAGGLGLLLLPVISISALAFVIYHLKDTQISLPSIPFPVNNPSNSPKSNQQKDTLNLRYLERLYHPSLTDSLVLTARKMRNVKP